MDARKSSRSKTFTIRQATAADAKGILQCLRSAFAPYRSAYTPLAYRDTVLGPRTIHQRLAEMRIFVAATPTGRIIGTIGYHLRQGQEGHIRGMAVRPTWQGCGAAERLLVAVESEIRSRGGSHIVLETTAPLERAVRFYERNGFHATGNVTDFFGMPLYEYAKRLE
jgi:N-acetylglutamate synthase-like GNAT family acetyltransferase